MSFQPKIYEVKSGRKMPKALLDVMILKANEIDRAGFKRMVDAKDALSLTGFAGDIFTALKVREKTNKNDGTYVELIQKVAGGSRGQAWCMWQQQAQISFAECLTGRKSLFPVTGSCASARKRALKHNIIPLEGSLYGDVWIAVYSSGKGHTGNFKRWIKKMKVANLNEGNTTSGKAGEKVVREGGGSYMTERDVPGIWKVCVRPFRPLAA